MLAFRWSFLDVGNAALLHIQRVAGQRCKYCPLMSYLSLFLIKSIVVYKDSRLFCWQVQRRDKVSLPSSKVLVVTHNASLGTHVPLSHELQTNLFTIKSHPTLEWLRCVCKFVITDHSLDLYSLY